MADSSREAVVQALLDVGITPERVGDVEFERAVREETERRELQTPLQGLRPSFGNSASRKGSRLTTSSPHLGDLGEVIARNVAKATPEELAEADAAKAEQERIERAGIEAIRAEIECEWCDDQRAIRITNDPKHPMFGQVLPCPKCVPLSLRMADAGAPKRLLDVTLSTLQVLPGKDAAMRAAASWDGKRSVVIASRTNPGDATYGTGKTTLAVAMMRRAMESNVRCRFIEASALLSDFRSKMDTDGGYAKDLDAVIQVPLLVLDDLGAERGTEWEVDILGQVIRGRYDGERTTIITTNHPSPSSIGEVLGGRVASRLTSSLWLTVGGKDLRALGI